MRQLSPLHASLYMLLLVVSFLLAAAPAIVYGVWINKAWIFNCDPGGYAPDKFLAYCKDKSFADYEHAAYGRALEPTAISAVKAADILMLGNSRPQFAFSNDILQAHFRSKGQNLYLLNFGYGESGAFARLLLERLDARPRVVIINADDFFDKPLSRLAMEAEAKDWNTAVQFWLKKYTQGIHANVCLAVPWFCGQELTVYRDRLTGVWETYNFPIDDVYDISGILIIKASALKAAAVEADAKSMIAWLEARGACVILTGAPSPDYDRDAAQLMAKSLRVRYLFPDVSKLTYFDDSHLNRLSAERYAHAFVQDLEPVLQTCPSN